MRLGACVKRSDGKETITGSVCVLRLPDKMFALNRIRYFACETFIHILRKANQKAAVSLLASCKKLSSEQTQTHLFYKLATSRFYLTKPAMKLGDCREGKRYVRNAISFQTLLLGICLLSDM